MSIGKQVGLTATLTAMEIAKTLQGSLTISTLRGRALVQSQPGTIIIDSEPKDEGPRFTHLWHIDDILLPLSVNKVEDLWITSFPNPEDEKAWLDVALIVREERKIYRGKAFVFDFKYEGFKANHASLRGATPLEEETF